MAVVLQFNATIASAYNISVQSFIDNSCYRFWSIILLHKKELRVVLLYLNRDYCSIYVVFLFQKCFFKSTFDDDIYKNNIIMVEWVVPGIQFRASLISPKNGYFLWYIGWFSYVPPEPWEKIWDSLIKMQFSDNSPI